MNDAQEAARKQELLALGKERTNKEKAIYESYGMTYPPKWSGGRDTIPRPPELKELEREIALKYKAILEKYGK